MVIPEDNKIIVFNKGIWKGLNVIIPFGGHIAPISIEGDNLLWKKAQKNDTKNIISEIINKIIPYFNPLITILVCNPWKVLSRVTSRHHW